MSSAMTGWPGQPVIYEVNTAVWLGSLSRAAGRPLTLADVAAADWDAVTPAGVDAVWLMGVWERSPAGLALATANADLQASFAEALPDLQPADVIGSPYCVHRYVAGALFGGPAGLAAAREALAARGVRLMLDYVPNHVAPDHPWVATQPELFVQGGEHDLEADSAGWLAVDGHVLAHGRDPYFPPWPDVVQLDAFSPAMRAATAQTLAGIAGQCDGIRCDMAMLLTNEIFAKTWGGHTGPAPAEEFWPAVIAELRTQHPETVLLAETYWHLEWELQQQGFNFCYDKRLYDRITGANAPAVRAHLGADLSYQSRLMRFLENHDEPRIASRMPRDAERAAAVAIATLPGATLWHEGQFEGRRVRPPVFLARRPAEPLDAELRDFYRRLVDAVHASGVRDGEWRLLDSTGWPDNPTSENLVAWCWADAERYLIVVNLSDQPAQAHVELPWDDLAGRRWRLSELLGDVTYEREGAELAGAGLFVALGGWRWHLLSVR